jgi:RNase adapter protein RapZ
MTEDILVSLIILTASALAAARRRSEPDVLVCVRCTGGKHRSVAIAVELETVMAQYFPSLSVTTRHRDLTSGRKATPPPGDLDTHQ